MDSDQQPAGVDLRIVGGGEPTPGQLAALVIALTPAGDGGAGAPATAPAPWRRAAVIEGVGGRPPVSPTDIDLADRRG